MKIHFETGPYCAPGHKRPWSWKQKHPQGYRCWGFWRLGVSLGVPP